jgi:anti-sigma regulatory factor (Ser/Thr protein kinase)
MTTTAPIYPQGDEGAAEFRHDALLYASDDEYLAGTVPFIRAGLAAGEPVIAVLPPDRVELVRDELATDADAVRFEDTTEVVRNPALLIPAWSDLLAETDGPVRGLSEPVWPGRTAAELAETQLHEALLGQVFADRRGFSLRCPYDVAALPPEVVTAVRRAHSGPGADAGTFDAPLPEPTGVGAELAFDVGTLPTVRNTVRTHGERAGLDDRRTRQLVLAVHEAAANSLRHGGGGGVLRLWRDCDTLVAEVQDRGSIADPLVGLVRPDPVAPGGRGVWMMNRLCDLVQVRSSAMGTVLRLHQRVS